MFVVGVAVAKMQQQIDIGGHAIAERDEDAAEGGLHLLLRAAIAAGLRPLQPRDLAFQDHEPRAAHAGSGFEIHHTQAFAQIDMVLGFVQRGGGHVLRVTPAAHLDIAMLVFTQRHIVGRQVGQGGQEAAQGL